MPGFFPGLVVRDPEWLSYSMMGLATLCTIALVHVAVRATRALGIWLLAAVAALSGTQALAIASLLRA